MFAALVSVMQVRRDGARVCDSRRHRSQRRSVRPADDRHQPVGLAVAGERAVGPPQAADGDAVPAELALALAADRRRAAQALQRG
jgi:hypothetical protein